MSEHDPQTPDRPVARHEYRGSVVAEVVTISGCHLLNLLSPDGRMLSAHVLNRADLLGLRDMLARAAGDAS